MQNDLVSEIGDGLGETVNTVGDAVSESSRNVFQGIGDVLGVDLAALSLSKILVSIVLLVALIAVSKIIGTVVYRTIKKSRMTEGMKKFISRAVRVFCYVLAIMIFFDSIGVPITSLIALFSLLGLAVSLSIQKLLGNIMSGVSLLMLRPFDIGDYIETDVTGTVKNIGLFYTEITTPDNKRVYIPNEKIIGEKLTNYSAEDIRRIDAVFNAGYEYDTELVKQALHDAIDHVDLLLKTPEPIVGIADYGDSAVLYDVRVWTKNADYLSARYALMDAVSASYKAFGVQMAYNRLEVDLVGKAASE